MPAHTWHGGDVVEEVPGSYQEAAGARAPQHLVGRQCHGVLVRQGAPRGGGHADGHVGARPRIVEARKGAVAVQELRDRIHVLCDACQPELKVCLAGWACKRGTCARNVSRNGYGRKHVEERVAAESSCMMADC
jgi:hypothetical protein